MSKYGNIKTTTSDGITHDSIKEASRWCELKLLERAGKIRHLQRQVKYHLIPRQEGEREVCYIADFVYQEDGKLVVEDVKGYRDPSSAGYAKFVIKRKLMLERYGIQIREV